MISKITGIILLLVLSIFFAYLVSPLVEFLRRPRTIAGRTIAIPKVVAIALAYLIILAAIVFAVFVILPSLSNQFPEFADQARATGDRWAIGHSRSSNTRVACLPPRGQCGESSRAEGRRIMSATPPPSSLPRRWLMLFTFPGWF